MSSERRRRRGRVPFELTLTKLPKIIIVNNYKHFCLDDVAVLSDVKQVNYLILLQRFEQKSNGKSLF